MAQTIVDVYDFWDIIQELDDRMKLLGWDRSQGKEYLSQTYNVSTRFRLNDEQLLEFLSFMRKLSFSLENKRNPVRKAKPINQLPTPKKTTRKKQFKLKLK
ncbi:MAG: hypothetical protein QNJ32_14540 [Xenococcaceae cyanobacterium MO_167.B27]|nr:hypothetical protein [Xenococcaceae cyanobacterium MO_167.B27]